MKRKNKKRYSNKGLRKATTKEKRIFKWVKKTMDEALPKHYRAKDCANYDFRTGMPMVLTFKRNDKTRHTISYGAQRV